MIDDGTIERPSISWVHVKHQLFLLNDYCVRAMATFLQKSTSVIYGS